MRTCSDVCEYDADDNGTSIMMAGSSMEITEFDGWMLHYIRSNIKDEA